ncbi:MAG: rod shape-determining protein MreD [Candidatus Cloacimonetes bacterium]|nr:rod shape-determining protein MreD [Candidatus Cloacimonadota bacterium]
MIVLILITIFTIYFQYFFAASFGLWNTVPNLFLPLIFYYSITRENVTGFVLAFFLGIIIDLNQPSSFGISSLLFLIIAFFLGKLKALLARQLIGLGFILVIIMNLFYFLLSSAIFLVFNTGNTLAIGKILILSLYNSAYSFVIILLLYLADHLKLSFTQK